jgi:hypothetical protein
MYKTRILVVSLLIVFISPCAIAMNCPPVPQVPTPSSEDLAFRSAWKVIAEPYSVDYTVKNYNEASYGIGYLRVININNHFYNWSRDITLPLWKAPDENSFYGWIHSGRVYPDDNTLPYALTGIGMVETEYEHNSFIVHATSGNGWLRIKLKPGKDAEVWTHQCHLRIGEVKLVYEEWESFLRKHGDWLHFRAQVPHSLREQPDVNSLRITKIGLDHKLVLLEINGDWMRIKVQQPDWTCAGQPEQEFKGSIHEGWVKWRDEKTGPWVWVYTRGC